MKVRDLKALVDQMKPDDEVLISRYNTWLGTIYREPLMDAISISRHKVTGEPVEVFDGDGGNEFALVIT